MRKRKPAPTSTNPLPPNVGGSSANPPSTGQVLAVRLRRLTDADDADLLVAVSPHGLSRWGDTRGALHPPVGRGLGRPRHGPVDPVAQPEPLPTERAMSPA